MFQLFLAILLAFWIGGFGEQVDSFGDDGSVDTQASFASSTFEEGDDDSGPQPPLPPRPPGE